MKLIRITLAILAVSIATAGAFANRMGTSTSLQALYYKFDEMCEKDDGCSSMVTGIVCTGIYYSSIVKCQSNTEENPVTAYRIP